ncbi:MAG: extracellular solute-binding protein [bacterium]
MKSEKIAYVIASIIVITLIILLSFILTTSFSNKYPYDTTKKIYYVDNISSAQEKVIKRFNELNKGKIEVIGINIPFSKFSTNERKELLARFLRSKSDLIDIIAIDQIWTARFAKWALPLNNYFNRIVKNDIISPAINTCVYDSTLIALPLYLDISLMYYREDIINKLPNAEVIKRKLEKSITWEDFITLKKQLNIDNPFFVFQAADFEGLICIYTELLAMYNESFINGDLLNINTKKAEKTLNFLVDLIYTYGMSPKDVLKFKENLSYDYYIQNNGVFLRAWPGFESEIRKYKNVDSNAVFVKVPTPHFEGTNPKSVFGGWNLIISKYSTKINESEKFLEFLMSSEAQKIMYEEGKILPVNKEIYADEAYIKLHPDLLFYKKLIETGVFRSQHPNYTHITDLLSYYLNLALEKRIDVKEALIKAENKISTRTILLK